METDLRYENYPSGIVILSNFVSLSIYGLGLWIIFKLGWVWAFFYLAYILGLEFRLIKNHCTQCFYWGKVCGFGRGRISSLLFKKGDYARFTCGVFSWKDMVPDLMVTLIPFLTGIVLLVLKFDLFLFLALLGLLLFTTMGNSYIRGSLTCRFCKQRDLGCPAYQLFNK